MTGPSLSAIVSERRLWIFGAIAALTAAAGFKLVPDKYALSVVSAAGYWFVLAAFIFFIASLWQTFRASLRAFSVRSVDWVTVSVIAVSGLVLLVHESFGFKIVMDEIMLLGTSMSMHLSRAALVPMRANDIQGVFTIVTGIIDKRPLFFPFLLSLVHDATGYRPENAFILNGILSYGFLGLMNAAGRLLGGRQGGILAVLLFAGLPLLAQNATGGGFELLNIVMIVATLLLGERFVRLRDTDSLGAFVASAILMTQVRYESAVFILPVAALILWVWIREGRVILPWGVVLSPLLLLLYPLHHRIFTLNDSAWQLQSKPGYAAPFSLGYIPENIQHALAFFFGKPTDQPNSLLLSALGFIALPFASLLAYKRVKSLAQESPAFIALAAFSVGFALHFLLMMCYFWGKFDDPVIRRLSLPMHVWLVLAILFVVPEFKKAAVWTVLISAAVLAMVVQGVPSMAAHAYNQEYLAGLETAWRREFIAEHPKRDYLAIDNDSVLWISHQVSSTPVDEAIHRKESIIFHERNRTFSDIYVFQRFTEDPETGKLTIREGDDLGPDYVLETVVEQRLQLLTLSRISRVKEIRSGKTNMAKPDPGDHTMPTDPAVMEKIRQEYLENFIRQLP